MNPPSTPLEPIEDYLESCYRAFLQGRPRPELPPGHRDGLDPEAQRRLEEVVARLQIKAEAARRRRKQRTKSRSPVESGSTPILVRDGQGPSAQTFGPTPPGPREKLRVRGYEIEDLLGQGGFGRVYRAVSRRHFGVEVALKILRLEGAAGTDTEATGQRRLLARLLVREARILAHIGHRNVVRYLGSGFVQRGPEAGTPFIATELIKGESLARRIGESPQDPNWSAGILVRVADALEFVHLLKLRGPSTGDGESIETGILHRDVKPSNILLGPGDEPYLTDFGIAGRVGSDADEGGFVAATPHYAAPEQTRRGAVLTPAVDVHGLGATLYHLLTGTPPRREPVPDDPGSGPPRTQVVRPRGLVPRVPVDLECVCLKCLEEDPTRRYQTAGAVRDDLRRFLDGKPVTAHPVGPLGRWARWARHDPRSATLASSLLLAGFLIFGMIATLYILETIRANTERRLRDRADKLAGVAQSAVDLTVDTVVIDDRAAVDRVPISVRKAVAERVIPYHSQLIALQGDDAAARAGVAKTLLYRATLRHVIGTPEEDRAAIADFLEAARYYAEAPQTSDNEFGRAKALSSLAAILGPEGRFHEAITHLSPAQAILDRLVAAQPGRTDYRFQLTLCLSNLATCHRMLGDQFDARKQQEGAAGEYQAAERAYAQAIDHAQRLVELAPEVPRHREWLSRTWGNMGELYMVSSHGEPGPRRDEAGRALFQAKRIAADLERESPKLASIQECLLTASLNYGDYLKNAERPTEAVAEFDRVLILYDRLHDRLPEHREFRWGQALSRASLGMALQDSNSMERARTILEDAARHYDRLVIDYPDVLQFASERSQTYDAMAKLGLDHESVRVAAMWIGRAIRVRFEVITAIARSDLSSEEKRPALAQASRRLATECVRWAGLLAGRFLKTGGNAP